MLWLVHHALVVATVMVGCVAAGLRRAPQGRLYVLLAIAALVVAVEHVVGVGVL